MRIWFFHPLIFYPLAAVLALLVIAVSVRPQSWPREPAPVAARVDDGALIYSRDAFDAPAPSPDQNMTVVRDFWGQPQNLRIAVLPDQPAPAPAVRGVRILMTPEDAALIESRAVRVEVAYNALPVNAASGLAVSLQGAGPAAWVSQEIQPEPSVARFELPPQRGVNAIGLRALHEGGSQAFGLEITRVRVIPHGANAAPGN